MFYGKYSFFCSLETAAGLPFYKGSTFRGALKQVVCALKKQEYLPIIEFCEKVHLGKQTSFVLGKIKAGIIQ